MFNPLSAGHLGSVVDAWTRALLQLLELLQYHPAMPLYGGRALVHEAHASAVGPTPAASNASSAAAAGAAGAGAGGTAAGAGGGGGAPPRGAPRQQHQALGGTRRYGRGGAAADAAAAAAAEANARAADATMSKALMAVIVLGCLVGLLYMARMAEAGAPGFVSRR